MSKKTTQIHPNARQQLEVMGESIRLARLRRRFTMAVIAERVGITPVTLRMIERGSAKVGIGCYAGVLHALSLSDDLGVVAKADDLGRRLQDAELPSRRRAPKRSKQE